MNSGQPIEPLPLVADLGGQTELDVATSSDIPAPRLPLPRRILSSRPSNNLPSSTTWGVTSDGSMVRDTREPERADLALLDGGRERAGADGAVIALLQQRQHALAKLGELGLRALAPEQIAAELAFELADGPGQRRLGDVAFLGGAREIQHPRHGEEIADLMHFHGRCAPPPPSRYA